jgi:hypothetical protein
MADIRCPKCGEPWDHDTIHDEVAERFDKSLWTTPDGKHNQEQYEIYYEQVKQEFFRNGCVALFGAKCNPNTEAPAGLSEIYSEFGDDLDGLISTMEDVNWMGE